METLEGGGVASDSGLAYACKSSTQETRAAGSGARAITGHKAGSQSKLYETLAQKSYMYHIL